MGYLLPQLRYSNGGGMLAASVGLMINVYQTVTGALMHSFPGVRLVVRVGVVCSLGYGAMCVNG